MQADGSTSSESWLTCFLLVYTIPINGLIDYYLTICLLQAIMSNIRMSRIPPTEFADRVRNGQESRYG
jgi:hypothetical protein